MRTRDEEVGFNIFLLERTHDQNPIGCRVTSRTTGWEVQSMLTQALKSTTLRWRLAYKGRQWQDEENADTVGVQPFGSIYYSRPSGEEPSHNNTRAKRQTTARPGAAVESVTHNQLEATAGALVGEITPVPGSEGLYDDLPGPLQETTQSAAAGNPRTQDPLQRETADASAVGTTDLGAEASYEDPSEPRKIEELMDNSDMMLS